MDEYTVATPFFNENSFQKNNIIKQNEFQSVINNIEYKILIGILKTNEKYLLIKIRKELNYNFFYQSLYEYGELAGLINEFNKNNNSIDIIYEHFLDIFKKKKYKIKEENGYLIFIFYVLNENKEQKENKLKLEKINEDKKAVNDNMLNDIKQLKIENKNLKNENELYKNKIVDLEQKIKDILKENLKNYDIISEIDSKIIDINDIKFIEKYLINRITKQVLTIKYNLLYRGSKDGYKAKNFHHNCDKKKPTLTIIKSSTNHRFGGFTEQSWEQDANDYIKDDNAFCFSIDKKKIYEIKKGENAICTKITKGPNFLSKGWSIINIVDDCNINESNTCKKDECFYNNYSEDYEINGGIKQFTVDEIEVYEIDIK